MPLAVFAAGEKGTGAESLQPESEFKCWGNVKCYVLRFFAWVGYLLVKVSSVFLLVGAKLFEVSANLSLDYGAYSKNGGAVAVYKGWQLTRDFVNLFFIFIILVVAISVILQISQYGSKEILFRLILIAVFINFSFFITQQIITAANSAAWFFYNPYKSEGLSNIFVEALNPQNLITGYKIDPSYFIAKTYSHEELKKIGNSVGIGECQGEDKDIDWNECQQEVEKYVSHSDAAKAAAADAVGALNQTDVNMISIIITSIGGVAVILTATFILLSAAVLFMIRTVILWVLMVLAPIAFISEILPATRGHARSWWRRLWREAFFAPAMMFMFFIAVQILRSNFIRDYILKGNNAKIGQSFIFNYYLVAQYVFILILLAICLVVARNMGATGANQMINYGTRMRKWAQGQAGKIPQRFAARYAAPAAEKVATSENWALRNLRRIPGVGAGARGVVKFERKRVDETEKEYSSLTSPEAYAKYKAKLLPTREDLMAITNTLTKRGDLGKLSSEELQNVHNRMKTVGMDTKDIETYLPALAAKGKTEEEGKMAMQKAVQRWRPDIMKDVAKRKEVFADDKLKPIIAEELSDDEFRSLFEAGRADENARVSSEMFRKSLVELYGGDIDTIADKLEGAKNFRLAKLMKTQEGYEMMKEYVPKASRHVAPQVAKENLQLTNEELERKIANMSRPTAAEQDKNVLKEIIQALSPDRLTAIFDKLADIEQQQLSVMLKQKDPKQLERILNYNPSLLEKTSAATGKKLSEELGYAAKNINTAADYIKQMPIKNIGQLSNEELLKENIILSLNKQHFDKLMESGNLNREIIDKITDTVKNRGSDEQKEALASSLSWRLKIVQPAPKQTSEAIERMEKREKEIEEGGG